MAVEINKRVATNVLNNLSKGMVPRIGAKYIAVGRLEEIEAFIGDLEDIQEGSGAFRLITAKYGGGKSFMLNLMKHHALEKNYVVMDAQMGVDHLFRGNKETGLNLFTSLVANLSIKGNPDGKALEVLLQRWVNMVRVEVAAEIDCSPEDLPFSYVEDAMRRKVASLSDEPQSYEFTRMVYRYARAYNSSEDVEPYVRWFRGEYRTKRECREELGTSFIVERDKWFQFIRLWSEFVVGIGYAGLVVQFDEAQILSKLNKKGRTENYEFLLRMFNSVIQDDVAHIGVYVCAIPETLDDPKRGMYTYEALRSRIEPSVYQGGRGYGSGCVMELRPLSNEELLILLKNVCSLHEVRHGYVCGLTDKDLKDYLQHVFTSIGASEFLTPRSILKNFIAILDRLHDDDGQALSSVLGVEVIEEDVDPFDRQLDDLDLDI